MLRFASRISVPFALVASLMLFMLNAASRDVLRSGILYVTSDSQTEVQRSASDTGGRTSQGNPEDPFGRSVREALRKQYEQKYGVTAEDIRRSLHMSGPTADFVGYDAQGGRWLIAEFKTGTNIGHAWDQLANTTKAFVRMNPGTNFNLRLYVDAERFEILSRGGRVYNWAMQEGALGYYDEAEEFVTSIVEGAKVIVQIGR